MGYQTIWGRVSASSRYQQVWVSGFNTTPVHGSPRWLDRQTTGEFNPGFKQCGDGAYPIRNSIFGIKVDQDELGYNMYGDPFVNQVTPLSIYTLFVCVDVCLFVSNNRQNGLTVKL